MSARARQAKLTGDHSNGRYRDRRAESWGHAGVDLQCAMSTQGCRIASASDLRLYRLYRGRVAVYGKNPHLGAISFSAAG